MRAYTDRLGVGFLGRSLLVFVAFLATFGLAIQYSGAADDEKAVDPSSPVIGHTPVTTAVRGIPVDITATISAQGGASITSKTVLVKVSDVGTPVNYPLTGAGSGGAYNAVIPVSFIKGVSVFWYSISVFDSNGRISGTPWIRVVILDPVEQGGSQGEAGISGGQGGGSGPAEPGAGGGGSGGTGAAGGGGIETTTFIVGGVLLAGGTAVAIENHGDSKKKSVPEPEPEPQPQPKKPSGGNNESAPVVEPEEPPCVTTGSETVMYENLSFYCDEGFFDIMVLVCGTCPDATISATTSWGEMDSIAMYNNDLCNPAGPKLALPLPDLNFAQSGNRPAKKGASGGGGQGFFNPGDETITVFANGVQIDQIVWPPLSDNDCL